MGHVKRFNPSLWSFCRHSRKSSQEATLAAADSNSLPIFAGYPSCSLVLSRMLVCGNLLKYHLIFDPRLCANYRLCPSLCSLHDMPDKAGVPDPETSQIVLPPPLSLSSERLAPYGLYLIDDGQTQFLWVGRDAVPQLLADVFDVGDRTKLEVGKSTLPELDNDFNERVRAVIMKSRDYR